MMYSRSSPGRRLLLPFDFAAAAKIQFFNVPH
jgi:hypothetical protein